MLTSILLAALLAAPATQAQPSSAQDVASAGAQGEAPKRVRSVMLFGDEACPKPESPDEIVVCARSGDSPYRIPEAFREPPPETGPGVSWVRRVEVIDEVNRAGLPGSCSPIGTGGQTGCTLNALRAWAEERKAKAEAESRVP